MYKAGKSGNPNGRPKGAANKNTKKIRLLLSEVIKAGITNIEADLQQLTAYERLTIICKLIPYTLTKAAADTNDNEIVIKLVDESTSHYDPDTWQQETHRKYNAP